MLELKNIRKVYKTGDEEVEALKGVSLQFRESEFVSILGQSGCGKTTLLNIIGGLDRYTSGDLIINGKSTKEFKDKDWDAYRNYKVGFVFQSYNLIGHQSILSNVELALTIGGISKKDRKEKAKKALEAVGLGDHINKKPNQLSGGQMQRVAIARALVNDPDIILADEPTGALDTKTSVQVMDILKEISKDKLIVMVTHNPELAEQYSSRIIRILDGEIQEDSNPILPGENIEAKTNPGIGKTKMSFFTAFRLSLNNLLTKKARTVLIAFAGSIGIIGIALIQATSNGFQNYVDYIQEDTLTSYPLSIMNESTDITSMLLSMRSKDNGRDGTNIVKEKTTMADMLSSISTNDLKSFTRYMNENYTQIEKDIKTIKNGYSVDPLIYTEDVTGKIAKLNPSKLFTSMWGGSSVSTSFSSMSSVFSQMTDDREGLKENYEVVAGRWPENYNELIICLSEPNSISDFLLYSLGLRDTDELTNTVTKVMSGEVVKLNNTPKEFTYDELMNTTLKLIRPTDMYKYNEKYDVYENLSEDDAEMKKLYENAETLKIVGIVCPQEDKNSNALSPGIAYTSDLISNIIDYSSKSDIVKAQLDTKERNVISGKNFDDKESGVGLSFQDLIKVDEDKIKSAFGGSFDQAGLEKITTDYITDIRKSISSDVTPAKTLYTDSLKGLATGCIESIKTLTIATADIDSIVDSYMASPAALEILNNLASKYPIPASKHAEIFSGMLKSMLMNYIQKTLEEMKAINPSATEPVPFQASLLIPMIDTVVSTAEIQGAINQMAVGMTDAAMQVEILTKVGALTGEITQTFAKSMQVDPSVIAGAFQLNMDEEQITRVISSMLSKKDATQKSNLLEMGYQDMEEPTYISFYFTSFDNKEHFLSFIDDYNKMVKDKGQDEKEIRYSDTTGILMGSVKTIVNAVSYVLIAFVSISLIVSSIMIGIITYISVYERTKEIGILRAIGASKWNISQIFNAETFIIGLLSGIFGIGISYALIPVINAVLHHFIGNIPLNVVLNWHNSVLLVILSVILTLIGGIIPARSASKKDPVIALRTE